MFQTGGPKTIGHSFTGAHLFFINQENTNSTRPMLRWQSYYAGRVPIPASVKWQTLKAGATVAPA